LALVLGIAAVDIADLVEESTGSRNIPRKALGEDNLE